VGDGNDLLNGLAGSDLPSVVRAMMFTWSITWAMSSLKQ
jgi:hypothetical protein